MARGRELKENKSVFFSPQDTTQQIGVDWQASILAAVTKKMLRKSGEKDKNLNIQIIHLFNYKELN